MSSKEQTRHDYDPVVVDPKWVASLPEYVGPTKVHALQIHHIQVYGPGGAPRDKKNQKVPGPISLATLPAGSAIPATERTQPEDYGEHAAARLTPTDKSYAPFEVDAAYMTDNKPHTGGYYMVFETGAEGFMAPEAFKQSYTLVVKPEEVKAREDQERKIADQAAEQAKEQAEDVAADPNATPAEKRAAKDKADAAAAVKKAPKPKKK